MGKIVISTARLLPAVNFGLCAASSDSFKDTGSRVPGQHVNSSLPRNYASDLLALQIRSIGCSVIVGAAALFAIVGLNMKFLFAFNVFWCFVEACFYAWYRLHCRRINMQPLPHKPLHYDALATFQKFVDSAPSISKYMSLESCLSRWFYDAPYDAIKKENVLQFLVYGFWYTTPEALRRQGQGHILELVAGKMEQAWGVTFAPGYNANLRFMAHLWEPLRLHHRPLFVYLFMELVALAKHVSLLACGFTCEQHQGFVFYRRMKNDDGNTQVPLFFLHGIGLGLVPYVGFLLRLAATGHPVVCIECRHLAMRLTLGNPSVDEAAAAVDSYMLRHKVLRAAFVGHSFGTFVLSRLAQCYPHRLAAACFMDPVCFCMFTGHLIRNFVYRTPRMDSLLNFLLDFTVWWVSRDVHCAASVCRGFYWSLLNLWPDQLPQNSLAVLSAHDQVMPVPETLSMLEEHGGVRLMLHHNHAHADFIFDGHWQDQIVEQVLRQMDGRLRAPASRHDSFGSLSPIRTGGKHM